MLKLTVPEFSELLKSKGWKRTIIRDAHAKPGDEFQHGVCLKVTKIMHKGELITLSYMEKYSYQVIAALCFCNICANDIDSINIDCDSSGEEGWNLEGCIIVNENNEEIKNSELDSYFTILRYIKEP